MSLGGDIELELRGFFEGALETAAGHRSSMGGQLERLEYGLPIVHTNDPEADMVPVIDELKRHDRVRRALSRMTTRQATTLRICYTPIPLGLVWGLVTVCGGSRHRGREVAALVVSRAPVVAPGASQWASVDELRKASAGKRAKSEGGASAKAELDDMIAAARLDLRMAEDSFKAAWREVKSEDRRKRHERFERSVTEALRGGR